MHLSCLDHRRVRERGPEREREREKQGTCVCVCESILMDPYKFVPSESFDAEVWTTNYGAPVTNATSSLSVGSRGPLLLEVNTAPPPFFCLLFFMFL